MQAFQVARNNALDLKAFIYIQRMTKIFAN